MVPELPELFAHLRGELGKKVYGSMGITRDDTEGRRIAVLRNWEFFRAPLGGIVCMHRDLHYVDILGVGMFLQTFLLALTARGLGTCVQVSIAGYPEIVREQLNIPEEYAILCGLAIGSPTRPFRPTIHGQNVIRSTPTSCFTTRRRHVAQFVARAGTTAPSRGSVSRTPNWRPPSARRPRP